MKGPAALPSWREGRERKRERERGGRGAEEERGRESRRRESIE